MAPCRTLWTILVVAGALGGASRAGATEIVAADCSQPAVQAAVDAANDGDTVRVPGGTCTWAAAVAVISKTITLQGAGADTGGTRIDYGGTNHTMIQVDAGTKTGRLDISGFWFVGGDSNYWNGTAMQLYGPAGWKNLRVHHNTFEGNAQWTIKGGSSTHGVIDHNTFRGTAACIMLYGEGAGDWATALTLGTADFFFVEDNLFEMSDDYGNTKHPVMDMDSGGRQVFRHNTIINGMWETHDKARSGLASANAYEIYQNAFAPSTTQWKGLDISAGTGVVWGNAFTGDFSHAIGAMDYKSFDPRSVSLCDGTDPADQNTPGESGWRCQYQIGSMGEGATASGFPLYAWSNTLNGSPVGMECTDGCNHVQAGRDYINNGSDPKPGYSPFTYPHPLVEPTASGDGGLDAAESSDGSIADAADAAVADGAPTDAGIDASQPAADGGTRPQGSGNCGCVATGRSAAAAWRLGALLLVLVLARRRPRRHT
jgi:hypothetical protein